MADKPRQLINVENRGGIEWYVCQACDKPICDAESFAAATGGVRLIQGDATICPHCQPEFFKENWGDKGLIIVRATEHGSPTEGHRQLGRGWRAVLESHWQMEVPEIPPHIAELMLAQLKLLRAARPLKFNPDNYTDLENYVRFAKHDAQEADRA